MGYLECNKCNGYYELQEGENPNDFDLCQCGGTLKYVKKINEENPEPPKKEKVNYSNVGKNSKRKNTIKNILSSLNELIFKINQKINITAIYIGLLISLIVPVIGFFIFGQGLLTGEIQITDVSYYIFLPMILIGGFITSLISCKKYSDGLINGGFLGLIFIFNLALIIGIMVMILMTVIGAVVGPLLDTFSSFSSTISQSSSSLSIASSDSGGYVVSIFILTIFILIFGAVGGWLGVWVKNKIKAT